MSSQDSLQLLEYFLPLSCESFNTWVSTRNFRLRLLLHFINYTSAIRQLTRSLKSCSLWQITRLRDVLKVFLFLIQAFGGHGTLAIKVLPFSQFPGQSGIFLPYMNNPWRNASRRPIKIRRLSESLFVVRLYPSSPCTFSKLLSGNNPLKSPFEDMSTPGSSLAKFPKQKLTGF